MNNGNQYGQNDEQKVIQALNSKIEAHILKQMTDQNTISNLMIKLKTTEMQYQMVEKKYNKLKGAKRRRRSGINSQSQSQKFNDTKKNSCISLPTDSCVDLSNCYGNRIKSAS